MAKRLAQSGRQKLEKEICDNLTLLSANTGECEEYIIELEALLKAQKSSFSGLQTEFQNTQKKLDQAAGRIEAQKDDIHVMRTDAKLAALQQATNEKEISKLQSQLEEALGEGEAAAAEMRSKLEAKVNAANAEKERRDLKESQLTKELDVLAAAEKSVAERLKASEKSLANEARERAALNEEVTALHTTINEYRECDKALRERIEILEKLLSEERKKAGQDLLLRIMELETMLESERNKVDDLDELPTVVHVSHSSAAAPVKSKTTTTVSTMSSSTSSTKSSNSAPKAQNNKVMKGNKRKGA